ncbi:ANTAR domain-containing response regulator [Paenibacillus sp. GCM10023248]|uniref:ANTAR domain-containing response regulator n=1 Tax=unclassified Paenibacillus TaxID=185978 RepID=UPI0023790495|nr:ANTAR domain-containing protein [Paenibacillus sp. MAHUQ-63]MDD9269921.1 ANTAR domain-containing protein [Paenibacillus sp. MAHUQ-63]
MLQSFILIDELKRTRSATSSASTIQQNDPDRVRVSSPDEVLKDLGFRVYTASTIKEVSFIIPKVDAVLLSVGPDQVEAWRTRILAQRSLPLFWWCDAHTFPSNECRMDAGIDGLIGSTMSSLEIHCALLLGVNHYFQRTEWQQEREQLLSKLEERKWVDQAKRILCEIKGISEAEAYDFLRKQAMNERKRMVDVATSIVKVYQILQDQNQGGRKR